MFLFLNSDNEEGSCSQDVCSLDMEFTQKIVALEESWLPKYHALNGFDRAAECQDIMTGRILPDDVKTCKIYKHIWPKICHPKKSHPEVFA